MGIEIIAEARLVADDVMVTAKFAAYSRYMHIHGAVKHIRGILPEVGDESRTVRATFRLRIRVASRSNSLRESGI